MNRPMLQQETAMGAGGVQDEPKLEFRRVSLAEIVKTDHPPPGFVSCSKCKFWDGPSAAGAGVCRRFAPRPLIVNLAYGPGDLPENFIWWPRSSSDDGCGDGAPMGSEAP